MVGGERRSEGFHEYVLQPGNLDARVRRLGAPLQTSASERMEANAARDNHAHPRVRRRAQMNIVSSPSVTLSGCCSCAVAATARVNDMDVVPPSVEQVASLTATPLVGSCFCVTQ